jgi:four helix bundle protein
MKSKEYDLCDRLFRFSVDVIIYSRSIKNSIETLDMKRQLIRAATSSGANYEESQGASSKPDFKAKVGISLKEMRESNYFLRIFREIKAGNKEKCDYLINESIELKKILGSILSKLPSLTFYLLPFSFNL